MYLLWLCSKATIQHNQHIKLESKNKCSFFPVLYTKRLEIVWQVLLFVLQTDLLPFGVCRITPTYFY